jgi:hypothetical protein
MGSTAPLQVAARAPPGGRGLWELHHRYGASPAADGDAEIRVLVGGASRTSTSLMSSSPNGCAHRLARRHQARAHSLSLSLSLPRVEAASPVELLRGDKSRRSGEQEVNADTRPLATAVHKGKRRLTTGMSGVGQRRPTPVSVICLMLKMTDVGPTGQWREGGGKDVRSPELEMEKDKQNPKMMKKSRNPPNRITSRAQGYISKDYRTEGYMM